MIRVVKSIVLDSQGGNTVMSQSKVFGQTDLGGEGGGSVVECRTPEREVLGSKPTAAVLCP